MMFCLANCVLQHGGLNTFHKTMACNMLKVIIKYLLFVQVQKTSDKFALISKIWNMLIENSLLLKKKQVKA